MKRGRSWRAPSPTESREHGEQIGSWKVLHDLWSACSWWFDAVPSGPAPNICLVELQVLGSVSMVTDWGKIVIHVLLAYSCLMEGGSVKSKLSWKSKLTKLKGIVHPKMKLCWKYTHFLGNLRFRWICFQTDLDKCSIAHHADPLQWMGAVRKRVQTADKEITIIHK